MPSWLAWQTVQGRRGTAFSHPSLTNPGRAVARQPQASRQGGYHPGGPWPVAGADIEDPPRQLRGGALQGQCTRSERPAAGNRQPRPDPLGDIRGRPCLSSCRGLPGYGAHGRRFRPAADHQVPAAPGSPPGAPGGRHRGRSPPTFGQVSGPAGFAERFFAIRQKLTFAVPPDESSSAEIASLARRNGHEVLLHLSLERNAGSDSEKTAPGSRERRGHSRPPVPGADTGCPTRWESTSSWPPGPGPTSPSCGKCWRCFRNAGSCFSTAVPPTNRSTPPWREPSEFRLPSETFSSTRRGDGVRAVETKLWELAELARRQGHAVGVGRDREATLLALVSTLPQLESRGFRVVPVSQLVQ